MKQRHTKQLESVPMGKFWDYWCMKIIKHNNVLYTIGKK